MNPDDIPGLCHSSLRKFKQSFPSASLNPRVLPAMQLPMTDRADQRKSSAIETPMSTWRGFIRRFAPSWFAIVMGTGIISILLYKLPYNGAWLYWISVAIFVINITLFAIFSLTSALRYICYPILWRAMITHPVESLFVATFPMSVGIIAQGIVNICVPAWGPWAASLAWVLWWIEAVTSVAICFYIPFNIMSIHKTDIASVTPFWLLPIVSTIICAATGGMVAGALPSPTHALWTLIVSYILWGIGIPLALFTLVLYYHRLTLNSIPPPAVLSSIFLPLGPLGEGGFGIMQLGAVSRTLFPLTKTLSLVSDAGDILFVFGFFTALLMWGFGLAWLFWGAMAFARARPPFNMGWWSIVFALGVFTGSTITLGEEMGSKFFEILGTVCTVILVLFWMVVFALTIYGTITGDLLVSPSLKQLEDESSN